jgi:hypothetical protein
MKNIVPSLSKMWLKILNLNTTLFPALQEELGVLSSKEEKLIRILDFAEIEKFVSEVKITNPPKHRKEIARAFVAKATYNIQTTRDLIDRLKADRVLRIIYGWRYVRSVPSESTFSPVYGELACSHIADKTDQAFIKEYLSDTLFFYNSTDSTAIDVREKPLKKEKKETGMQKELIISTICAIKPTMLNQSVHSQKNAGISPLLMLIPEIVKRQKQRLKGKSFS